MFDQLLRRILVIHLGSYHEVAGLDAAMQHLVNRFSNSEFVLLCTSSSSRIALSLPGIHQVLVHRALSAENPLSDPSGVLDLIEVLQAEAFDAAILFPDDAFSPHPIAYVCYLAGIPIRIGHSLEFGGGVLSHWVREIGESEDTNLAMLHSAGLLTTAGGI